MRGTHIEHAQLGSLIMHYTFITAPAAPVVDSRTARNHSQATRSHGRPVDRYRRVHRPCPSSAVYLRRRVAALLALCGALVLAVAGIGVAVGGYGGTPAYAAESPAVGVASLATVDAEMHVARSGESLWSIADQHRDGRDRAAYIEDLIDLNGSTSIQVGQGVILP
jgi:hypothetical protein